MGGRASHSPAPKPHFYHFDPLMLKDNNKAKITGKYIHEGAVVFSSYFYHLNFPKVQGCSSDPETNSFRVYIGEAQCTSSFFVHMQYMVLVSKLSHVQFVAGITRTS